MESKNIVRKIVRESIDRLFELTAAEIKNTKEDIVGDIERTETHIERAEKEAEVAKSNKINTQKTKGNIKDIDSDVEKQKKVLAMKEFEKYKDQEKDKYNLTKDLENEKQEDLDKKKEIDKLQPNEQEVETTSGDAIASTPDTPTTASSVG